MASDKGLVKGVTAKAAGGHAQGKGQKEVTVATGKHTNESGTAKRQLEVEVIIRRSASSMQPDRAEKDELASDSAVEKHIGGITVAENLPSRSAKADLDVVPGSKEEAGSQTGQPMFWGRSDEGSLDYMLENLLPKDTGKAAKEKGNVTKKAPRIQAPFGISIGRHPILHFNPNNKASLASEQTGANVSLASKPRSTPLATGHSVFNGAQTWYMRS